MRVLIFGAGVVGQIYAGRLIAAGHDVTMLARGDRLERLSRHGITLELEGERQHAEPALIDELAGDDAYDVALVAVRRDQLIDALPAIAALPATQVVMMLNVCLGLEWVRRQVGAERTLFGFPGLGGRRLEDGAIEYLQVPQQNTTVERRGGDEQPIVDLFASAELPVDVEDDMEAWLKTHAVFMAGVGAAILAHGGDSVALAEDSDGLSQMVRAIGEGFKALGADGVSVTPAPLKLIFTTAPKFVAVRYWRGALKGPIGTLTIAPHMSATRDSEQPVLCADVRRLTAAGETPHLDTLLAPFTPSAKAARGAGS